MNKSEEFEDRENEDEEISDNEEEIKDKNYDDSDDDDEEEEDEEEEEEGEVDDDVKEIEHYREDNDSTNEDSLDDYDSEEEDNDEYLQTFEKNIHKKVIQEYHPELIAINYKEIETLCKIVRDENGIIVDPFHKTSTFITKYEKARIIGERAKQLNSGAQPFVKIDASLIDGYLIALKEFEEKKIPFIIQRPLPNGGCEYWRLSDLEII